ncbi:formate dehydrogenase accessory protein FdhE [Cupriavidus sp. SZY C1]|uniref:formate dehydrogenase accessory protein FdhE n=1 Tax=Cupriavidus sp. SZY C1 TaxID=3055037 RepID=UPI0028BB2AD5|nr:formate dehydrogenase accessory protein FdhE [Cupriavidus sp. SZY C1]MDT6964093.1 formate dehydrogenase accessory protein FdhE [Cupriavidus sp. SZY C1]
MVQRILEPAEIESIDHIAIARVRLPERAEVFGARAQRLRQLAPSNPIGPYLLLMAAVADAQHAVAQSLDIPPPSPQTIERAGEHCMPLLPAQDAGAPVSAPALFERLAALPELAAPLATLRALSPAALADQVSALLGQHDGPVDPALAPLLMAALQLDRTVLASGLREGDIPVLDVHTVCPVCGTPPVASIVRIGGRYQGLRYLHCGLCATEWHMVRVKCSHCETTEGISYYAVEGHGDALKAETCDQCHHYRKISYMEKDPLAEPLADDLASLALDVMMGEAGYGRANGNPLLWLPDDDDDDADGGEARR